MMKASRIFTITAMIAMLSIAGCGKTETPVANAVESTKDALDMREHEKLKDAGENAQDAIDDTIKGIKEETGTH